MRPPTKGPDRVLVADARNAIKEEEEEEEEEELLDRL
jgi:hypothetical protein